MRVFHGDYQVLTLNIQIAVIPKSAELIPATECYSVYPRATQRSSGWVSD